MNPLLFNYASTIGSGTCRKIQLPDLEIRCKNCNKLLLKACACGKIKVKCPRCGAKEEEIEL